MFQELCRATHHGRRVQRKEERSSRGSQKVGSDHTIWHFCYTPRVVYGGFPKNSRSLSKSVGWASQITQLVKNPPTIQETPVRFSGSGRSAGEGIGYPLQYSWASLVAQLVKNAPAVWETWFNPWVGKIPWRRERLLTLVFRPDFHFHF